MADGILGSLSLTLCHSRQRFKEAFTRTAPLALTAVTVGVAGQKSIKLIAYVALCREAMHARIKLSGDAALTVVAGSKHAVLIIGADSVAEMKERGVALRLVLSLGADCLKHSTVALVIVAKTENTIALRHVAVVVVFGLLHSLLGRSARRGDVTVVDVAVAMVTLANVAGAVGNALTAFVVAASFPADALATVNATGAGAVRAVSVILDGGEVGFCSRLRS